MDWKRLFKNYYNSLYSRQSTKINHTFYFCRLPYSSPEMNHQLRQAYLATSYTAKVTPDTLLNIKIGKSHPTLDKLLTQYATDTWAYLTAWNPLSELCNLSSNQQRNKELEKHLIEKPYFKGKGIAQEENWEEESFLILDIEQQEAIQLGKKFQQNAILVGEKGKKARLIILEDT